MHALDGRLGLTQLTAPEAVGLSYRPRSICVDRFQMMDNGNLQGSDKMSE